MAGWVKMPLGMEAGLGPDHFVLDGDPAPLPKKGAEPPILAHVYCGQTAGWIKMALDVEVGFGPGHIVLDGDLAALPRKGTELPIFCPFLLWPNGCMYQDNTWYGGRPRPRRLVFDGDPGPEKRHSPTQFLAHVAGSNPTQGNAAYQPWTVARRLDGSRCHLLRR